MDAMRRPLLLASLVVGLQAGGVVAQRPTNTGLSGNGCRHEGLIATGLFATRFHATETTYSADSLPTEFRLRCESQQLVFEHQEWAGQKVADPDHWYEYWDVVRSVRDTLAYNALRLTFAKLGRSDIVGVLTFNDYQGVGPSVLFAVEYGYLTKKFFGRLIYVAPDYQRDIPLPSKQ